jgi:cyd operon protein YbgT
MRRASGGLTDRETAMWYFTWILGIGVALGFGIINVMWLEANDTFARDSGVAADKDALPPGAKDTRL